MTTNNAMFFEGQSVTRPPLFNDPFDASTIDTETNRPRPKIRRKLTAEDRTHLTLNAKAMNVLYSALDSNESVRVNGCKSVKEIWNKLREIHEGSENVREQKKSILVTKYESFKMEPHENIDKMYCRFNDLIKDL
ncbi:uncharacterized protein [Coffea arabica]|uniref:Uncharacterized protein n=1 Tax=Coffea arabica TaxID=13443 RepID=A0ABM4VZ76_COFAR